MRMKRNKTNNPFKKYPLHTHTHTQNGYRRMQMKRHDISQQQQKRVKKRVELKTAMLQDTLLESIEEQAKQMMV